jgi:hypothetical protein
MDKLAIQYLIACDEFVAVRRPLLEDLAAALGITSQELFYFWLERRCRNRGSLSNGDWGYYFHGYECDFRHRVDGRFLRFDFGPGGTTEAFTEWGVTQFVMTAKSPWPVFPELQAHLAEMPPPYNEFSGAVARAISLYERLEKEGFVDVAAPDLIAFGQQHTSLNTEGVAVLRLPENTPEHTCFDVSVAERKVLTTKGRSFLASLGQSY